MLFCNLTPLDGRFVNGIVFCRKSEFCEYVTSLHIQHSIYARQFEFFVFTMKQIAFIFCNVSFAGSIGQTWQKLKLTCIASYETICEIPSQYLQSK